MQWNKLQQAASDWRVWLLFLSLQLPSLRALFKYVPESLWFIIPLYLAGAWLLYADILHDGAIIRVLKRISSRAWPVIALLVLVFVVQAVIYPRADALKYEGRGTPQDDALVAGGNYLVNGLNPYDAETYRRELVSAGPGWIMLALPFTTTGTIGFLSPVWLLISVIVLWRITRSSAPPVLFLVLLMSSVAFWELTVTGSDMIAIGCALLVSFLLVRYAWMDLGALPGHRTLAFFLRGLSIVLLSMVATSRIVFAYAVPLIGGFIRWRGVKRVIAFILLAGGLTFGLHLFFYLWNPLAYFPLYRFSEPGFLPGIAWPLTTAVVSLLLLILAIQQVGESLASWIFWFWLALAVAMFLSALGDLMARSFALPSWEGANYLGVVMPIFVAWLVLSEKPEPSRV